MLLCACEVFDTLVFLVQVTRGMELATPKRSVRTVTARNPGLAPRVSVFAVSLSLTAETPLLTTTPTWQKTRPQPQLGALTPSAQWQAQFAGSDTTLR